MSRHPNFPLVVPLQEVDIFLSAILITLFDWIESVNLPSKLKYNLLVDYNQMEKYDTLKLNSLPNKKFYNPTIFLIDTTPCLI